MNQSLEGLNELPANVAEAEFLKCCGSRRWARAMAGARPFANAAAILASANTLFDQLTPDDWLEAFLSHPRIGEKKAAATQSDAARKWSAQEQSRTQQAA